ncbi:MFS transporter [Actinopolymorpha alba]|uniref:MFS transporter n=1 Tax=Actinopolymorpha alba TaxID=533267 RepID=UPI0003737742|nr:MFS transporter [Actinopolymorpha alba]
MTSNRLVNLFLCWIGARAVLHNGWWLVVSLYMVVDAGLSPAQLLMIASAQGVASVIFELPAGVVADAVSRKWAIVVAHALMGTAMITTGLFPGFIALMLSQMLWGVSWTFSSGADVAWITDELNQPKTIHRVLTRQARWQLIGAAVGMIALGSLASVIGRPVAIVAAGIAMLLLGVVVAVTFPERNFVPIRTRRWRAAMAIARRGAGLAMRDRTILVLVIVTVLVNGAADSFGRIYPVQLANLGFPSDSSGTAWFTALGIAGLITGALSLYAVERRIHTEHGARGAMLLACSAGVVGLGILGLAPNLTFAITAVLIASGIAMPLVRTVTTIWVNRRTTSDVRATMHSFLAQAEYVGEIFCAAVLAAISGLTGAAGAVGLAAVLFGVSIMVIARRRYAGAGAAN